MPPVFSRLGVLTVLFAAVVSFTPTAHAQSLGPALMAASGAFVSPAPSVSPSSNAAPEAATPSDTASIAREIARRVRHFHAFRTEAAHATWRKDERATWRFQSSERCLASLDRLGVPYKPLMRGLTTPVSAPVVLEGPVAGVSFRPAQRDRAIELSCELAARLPALAKLLRAHGVRAVHVNSSYRDQPRVSFHTFGLGLDISAFETPQGSLVVARDFELSPETPTCSAAPTGGAARALQKLACAIAESSLFSTVITPNYNAGHHDHFHLDMRPNDPNFFVR